MKCWNKHSFSSKFWIIWIFPGFWINFASWCKFGSRGQKFKDTTDPNPYTFTNHISWNDHMMITSTSRLDPSFYCLLIKIIDFNFPLFYYCLMTSAGGHFSLFFHVEFNYHLMILKIFTDFSLKIADF